MKTEINKANNDLLQAARTKNIPGVEEALRNGADVNGPHDPFTNSSLLSSSIIFRDIKMAKVLLKAGAKTGLEAGDEIEKNNFELRPVDYAEMAINSTNDDQKKKTFTELFKAMETAGNRDQKITAPKNSRKTTEQQPKSKGMSL